MSEDHIRYDILAQEALRGVIKKVLIEVSKTGLPGEHHFFISVNTRAPGVRISQALLEKYPEEMTIVLQYQFWELKVTEAGFEIGLSFDGKPEHLYVPFTAIKGFLDPSVQFGLQFDLLGVDEEEISGISHLGHSSERSGKASNEEIGLGREKEEKSEAQENDHDEDDHDAASADVVNLDAFRNKPDQ